MRVADSMKFGQVRSNINKNRTEMSELQNQAATQKRVTKPSDDPVAAARVLTGRVELSGQNQYLKNMNYAKSFLSYTDQSLGDLSDMLVRVKELALGQASDATSNEQSRRVVGTEVEQIFKQMIHVGNRKMGDRFIFGGFKTNLAPFNEKGSYGGDKGEMLIHVDKDSFVSMNIPGNKVFLGDSLSKDGISHSTAIQPKTIEELKQALAAEKQEEAQKEKQIQQQQRQQQDAELQVRGLASVGPAPQNEEAFGKHSTVGEREGKNLFNVVKGLEISLMTNDKSGVQGALEDLDEAIDQVVLARAQVGARFTALESSHETLMKTRVDVQGGISQLEDADLFKVVSDMNKTETSLEATMKSAGKLIQPSLMDFIR